MSFLGFSKRQRFLCAMLHMPVPHRNINQNACQIIVPIFADFFRFSSLFLGIRTFLIADLDAHTHTNVYIYNMHGKGEIANDYVVLTVFDAMDR